MVARLDQRRAAADSTSGHSSRLEAEAASLASEASGVVGELVAKRPRVESDRLDTRPEEARAAAASNRNHDSERRRREANKEWRVEEEALLYEFLQREEELMGGSLGLRSENDDVATVDDLGDQSLKVLLGAFGPSLRALLMSASLGDLKPSSASLIMELVRSSAQASEGAS